MVAILDKIFRAGEGRALKQLEKLATEVNSYEATFVAMSDDELRAMTGKFKERLSQGEDLDDLLTEAFAVVREASKRTLGQRHYDVQIMGGAALHRGNIAEMRTGEGKTLVATLPSYLNALTFISPPSQATLFSDNTTVPVSTYLKEFRDVRSTSPKMCAFWVQR